MGQSKVDEIVDRHVSELEREAASMTLEEALDFWEGIQDAAEGWVNSLRDDIRSGGGEEADDDDDDG